MYKKFLCIPLVALGLLAGCASYETRSAAPARIESGTFVGTNGMTLYTFDRDTVPGQSACNGACATNWPPLTVSTGTLATKEYPLIIRMDGTRQVTLEGQPLYYYAKDAKRGETTGDGRGEGAWKINRR